MKKQEKNILTEKKTAAIYCRVSTEEQASKDENSLDVQESTLRKYCADQGLIVNDEFIYVDRGISGKSLSRPEIQRLRHDAKGGLFHCVVATKLDRLSRSVKDFLDLDYELQELKIDIKIQSQNFDTTTPSGRMLRMMLMAFAEFERDMISERTSESVRYLAQEGYPRGGIPPLGYNKINKLYVLVEEEAELVKYIFSLYLSNPSTARVADILNEKGYKTKPHTTKKGVERGGKPYMKSLVHQILTNQEYIGLIQYKDKVYQGKHEAIIEENVFNLVQQQLKRSAKKQKFVTKRKTAEVPLGEFLYCGFCGHKMVAGYGRKEGKKYYYYKCTKKTKETKTACNAKTLNAVQLENFIGKIFEVLATDDRSFDMNFQHLSKGTGVQLTQLEKERKILLSNLAKNKGILNNYNNIIGTKGIQALPKSTIEAIREQELVIESVQSNLNVIERKIARIKTEDYDEETLQRAFKNYVLTLKTMPADKRRSVYKYFFERITSFVDDKTGEGNITLKIHTDGEIVRKWSEMKKFELPDDESSHLRTVVYPGEDLNLRPTV